jgi:uncharacterized membrane protein
MNNVTDEQKKALNRAGFKFMLKCFWNGMQHALLGLVANVMLTLLVLAITQNPEYSKDAGFVQLAGCIGIGILVIMRVLAVHKENVEDLNKEVAEIIK